MLRKRIEGLEKEKGSGEREKEDSGLEGRLKRVERMLENEDRDKRKKIWYLRV